MSLVGAVLAVLIGVALGLLGGGGSILTVPAFVYALGLEPKRAIVMSLPVVGVAALASAVAHWRRGNVALGVAAPFAVAAVTSAFVSARLAQQLNGHVQLVLFAVVMLAAAASMMRSSLQRVAPTPTSPPSPPLLALIGVGVGALTGTVGAGGGFLIVPALVLVGGLSMSEAAGTSLIVIALNATAGFLGYTGTVDTDWSTIAVFAALMAIGGLGGAALQPRVPQRALKGAFAVLLLVVASTMLFQYATI